MFVINRPASSELHTLSLHDALPICTPPPENAAGGRIAFKTGTSYGYRDAWSVGFDGRRTVGVWVGRPDGAPVRSEEHTSELQSRGHLVCRLLLEKKK